MLELINEVLDISRIEAGGVKVEMEPVDAGAILEVCAELMRPLAEQVDTSAQVATPHLLYVSREGDPRGGLQSGEYRTADPREVVEEDGTVMSGPAGAPQEGESVEERRSRDR